MSLLRPNGKLWTPELTALVRVAFLALLIALLLGQPSNAVDVGDEVQFERAGQTLTGRVTGVRPGGIFLEVEAAVGGRTGKLIVKATSVRPVAKPDGRQVRTWKDSSGQFEIEAALQTQTAFDVVLRKQDGSTITVPLERLSVADQEYVASLESGSENPFERGPTSPAASPSRGIGSGVGARGGAFSLPKPTLFGKSGDFAIQKLSAPSGVEADPSPLDFAKAGNASMQLPEPETREEPGRPVVVSPTATQLCYSSRPSARAPEQYTRIMLMNGEKRTTREVARLEGDNVWLASAEPSSGDVLGVVMKRGEDKTRSLCVVAGIREGNPRIVAHWRMFPKDENKADYVRFRRILANQVVVVVYGGQVHAFDYGTKREIWTAPSQMFNEPAITPGGRYAAVAADQQCAILETKSGKQLGSIPLKVTGPVALGFSPDGLRLALAHGTQVRVVDVTTGVEQLLHEANVDLGGMGKPVMWLDDQFVLLPTGVMLDVNRNLIVWKYRIDQDAMEYADLGDHALLMFKGRNAASVVRLPHDAARQAAGRDTSGITAVRAGDPVSIAANGSGPGVSAGDLRNWLTDVVSKAGYQASSSTPTEVVGSVSRGKTKTESYRIIGRGFATEEVTYTPYISKVEIRQNGKTLWQRSTQSGLPFMIPDGKTLQEVARENERPNAKFFQNIKLPQQVLKPEFQSGFGSSRVSAMGIVDQPQ